MLPRTRRSESFVFATSSACLSDRCIAARLALAVNLPPDQQTRFLGMRARYGVGKRCERNTAGEGGRSSPMCGDWAEGGDWSHRFGNRLPGTAVRRNDFAGRRSGGPEGWQPSYLDVASVRTSNFRFLWCTLDG